jgi:hypothetical protein
MHLLAEQMGVRAVEVPPAKAFNAVFLRFQKRFGPKPSTTSQVGRSSTRRQRLSARPMWLLTKTEIKNITVFKMHYQALFRRWLKR